MATEKIPYKDALDWAAKYDNGLRATDKRFNGSALIVHQDGSVLLFDHAFLLRRSGYLMMFSEHHGFRVFDPEDVVLFRVLGPKIAIETKY